MPLTAVEIGRHPVLQSANHTVPACGLQAATGFNTDDEIRCDWFSWPVYPSSRRETWCCAIPRAPIRLTPFQEFFPPCRDVPETAGSFHARIIQSPTRSLIRAVTIFTALS